MPYLRKNVNTAEKKLVQQMQLPVDLRLALRRPEHEQDWHHLELARRSICRAAVDEEEEIDV